jgi:hypothetical protein
MNFYVFSCITLTPSIFLLGVKVSQKDFKTLGNGRQYASIVVNGKTGNREVVLTNSLPYLKDWLNVHPLKGNSDAYLFLSQSDKNLNKQLTGIGLFHIYRRYKLERFPSLLLQQDSDISESDKQHIRQLLKKPFNPYLRRHIGLTQRAKQIHEYELRQYSGWSKNSKMHLRYIHWFNNQGSNAVLKAEGFVTDEASEVEKLKPVYCSNCNEANIKNSKWCSKCGMILSFSGYQEAVEKQLEVQNNQLKALISALGNINDQNQVNQMAQTLYSSGILNVSSSSSKKMEARNESYINDT